MQHKQTTIFEAKQTFDESDVHKRTHPLPHRTHCALTFSWWNPNVARCLWHALKDPHVPALQSDISVNHMAKMVSSQAPGLAAVSQDNVSMSEIDKAAMLTMIREEVPPTPYALSASHDARWVEHFTWAFPRFCPGLMLSDHHQRDWGQRVEEEIWRVPSRGHGDEVWTTRCLPVFAREVQSENKSKM